MKNLFTILLVASSMITVRAQTANAIVFSEDGDNFTLFLNGEQKNDWPQANVKMTGLTGSLYSAKIRFENSSIPEVNSKMFAVEAGTEVTYVIRKNKKGEHVLKVQSYNPINSTVSNDFQGSDIDPQVRQYAEVVKSPGVDETPQGRTAHTIQHSVDTHDVNSNTNVTVTETTTTSTSPSKSSDNVNVKMNIGGINMGVDINSDFSGTEENTKVTSTARTTTGSTENWSDKGRVDNHSRPVLKDREIVAGPCHMRMTNDSFLRAKRSIEENGFDDTRLTVAKQVVNSNCLSVSQIKEIMGVFSFEETKLDFAKHAYSHCANTNEYYLINDVFSFSSSIDELDKYIRSK